jgi:hypothetical protein
LSLWYVDFYKKNYDKKYTFTTTKGVPIHQVISLDFE